MTTKQPALEQILEQLSEEKLLTTHDQKSLEELAEKGYIGEKEEEIESWDVAAKTEVAAPTNTPDSRDLLTGLERGDLSVDEVVAELKKRKDRS